MTNKPIKGNELNEESEGSPPHSAPVTPAPTEEVGGRDNMQRLMCPHCGFTFTDNVPRGGWTFVCPSCHGKWYVGG